MGGIVWVLLGLDPVHPFLFVALLVLAACCFSAIAHLLRTALGEAGSSLLLPRDALPPLDRAEAYGFAR